MKKSILILLTSLVFIPTVYAEESPRVSASLVKCESAEVSWFKINGKKEVVRLIAYDISSDNPSEINAYACDLLKNAQKIELEYDIDKKDEYNRTLAWIYVDDKLMQDDLIAKGYGQVNYVKGDYQHLDELCLSEADAVKNTLGIWTTGVKEKYCDSGEIIKRVNKKEQEKEKEKTSMNKKMLKDLILLNGIMLLLIITMHRGTYAKKR